MGAAESSNVASAVASVTNDIQNSTTANAYQTDQITQVFRMQDCKIDAAENFDVNFYADTMQKSTQLIDAKTSTNLSNTIAQQMVQKATSEVGFLGIGYAKANNVANQTANTSSSIQDAVSTVADQFGSKDQKWECVNTQIKAKNITVNFSGKADFFSDQVLKVDRVQTVVNDIQQKIDQTATAKIEGAFGCLLLVVILIVGLAYCGVKPLSSPAAKTAMTAGIGLLLVSIITGMYIGATPPFFSDPENCILHSKTGRGNSEGTYPKDVPKSISIDKPYKYAFPIVDGEFNLVQMVISKMADSKATNNAGYRIDVMNNWAGLVQTYESGPNPLNLKVGVPKLPNPLMNPALKYPESAGKYFTIPVQYRAQQGGKYDDQPGKCTPIAVEIQAGGNSNLDICSQYMAPDAMGDDRWTTNPIFGIANFNKDEWNAYLDGGTSGHDTSANRQLYARFVLCALLGIPDLHIYMQPREPIAYTDEEAKQTVIDIAENRPEHTYLYGPTAPYTNYKFAAPNGGTISGKIGVVNSRMYKFQQFMKKIGAYILIILGLITFIVVWRGSGKK